MSIIDSGAHLLTDPLLTDRVAHLTRRRGSSPGPLRPDAVLVSHLHHDHLHLPSLRRLPEGTPVIVPRGGGGLLASLGLHVVDVGVGEVVDVMGVRVTAVRAVHDGRRHPGSSWRAPALGYLVEGSRRTWFAGDTGPSPTLGQGMGPVDVALLPVGGWGPLSRPSARSQHLGPSEAALVARQVGVAVAVPIHYGTLWPQGLREHRHAAFLDPGQRFASEMATVSPRTAVRVLRPGESVALALPDLHRDGR